MNKHLSYFMSRMQGVSTNRFRLEPQNSSTAGPNQQIRFSLPSNALLNTRSLQLMFSATTSGAAAGARLPPVERLIDRYELLAGGVQVSQGSSLYNVLRAAKDAVSHSKVDSVLGHPEYVRAKSYVDGSTLATTDNEVYSSANGATQFGVCYFDGFLGTVQPSIIDTSLVPDLTLVIHLAGTEVLSSVAGIALSGTGSTDITDNGAGSQSFTLSNIRLNCEVIGLASGVYDELVQRRISDNSYIELIFKGYQTFVDTHTGSTKFSISSQSLDRLWIVHRSATAAAGGGGLVVVNGHKRKGCFTSGSSLGTTAQLSVTQDIGLPSYDSGGVLSTNREKYNGRYFNFSLSETGGPAKFQVQLNGSMIPQFQANAEEMYAITKDSVEGYGTQDKMTLDQYRSNYFVQCIRLNLPDSEAQASVSGIDTRSINLAGVYNTSGVTAGSQVIIFGEMTSTLRVGANRAIEVVT